MADYRIVVIDANGNEVANVVALPVNPADVLVIMPCSLDVYISEQKAESIIKAFARYDIRGIVLPFPATLARLERIE